MNHQFQSDAVRKRFPLFFLVANHFRNRRFRLFEQLLGVHPMTTPILDVGGTYRFWKGVEYNNVTLLNTQPHKCDDKIKSVTYDGGRFPFSDRQFEIVFSNSTIEHVGDFWDQQLFASEIMRVGKKYFVQTPCYWFPYEPHAHIPLYQFLPANFKMWLREKYPKSTYPIELLSIRLLTQRELKYLFPDSEIRIEWFLFLPKAYFAIRAK